MAYETRVANPTPPPISFANANLLLLFTRTAPPYRAIPATNVEFNISIYLTNLAHAVQSFAETRADRVISLLDPGDEFPVFPGLRSQDHLKIEVHDIERRYRGYRHPSHEHMAQVLNFGRESAGRLLVHCFVGRSRSTASILAILADRRPSKIPEFVAQMAEKAVHAQPNSLMIALTDDLLGLNGELVSAASTLNPSRYEMRGWIHFPDAS